MNESNPLVTAFGGQKRWVVWRKEVRDGKVTKVPYQTSGTHAKATAPETWCTHEEAQRAGGDGVGIVFTPDGLLLGVDLDHVFEDGYHIPPYVLEFINRANTYTEMSPSRTGAHVYLKLTEPLNLEANRKKVGKFHPDEGYECYTSARFFTVTGEPYSEVKPVRTVTPQDAHELLQVLGYPWKEHADSRSPVPSLGSEQGNEKLAAGDTALLRKMFGAKNGAEVLALWQGDTSKHNGDDSAADMALCTHLAFWTAKNVEQMARLWRNSPLGSRSKTQRRDDYVQRTVAAACEGTQEVYRGKVEASVPHVVASVPTLTTLRDLLAEPEEQVSWVVEDMLPVGGLSILIAKPKVGKTTLARQLILNVSRGEDFLGLPTASGPVIYISLEDKRSEVRNHFRLMGADGSENLSIFVGAAPEEATKWVEAEIKRIHPILIVIDPLFRFARVSDVSAYAEVTTAFDPLLHLARKYSVHLMCVHHARKSEGEGGDVSLGSTAIFGSVDTMIVLKKSKGVRTIETHQRYGKDIESSILTFNDETKTVSLGGSKEESDLRDVETSILEFLKVSFDSLPEAAIRDAVKSKNEVKVRALRKLVANGTVTRTGKGGRGDPFLYALATASVERAEQATDSSEEGAVPTDEYPEFPEAVELEGF